MPTVPRYPCPVPFLAAHDRRARPRRGSIALPSKSTIPAMNPPSQAYEHVLQTLENAASATGRPPARLLAVSKTQPASAVAGLAAKGQRAFGENYVQEGVAKAAALAGLGLEWHLI